jgi:DNA-binding transcriptional ArsR family regulator
MALRIDITGLPAARLRFAASPLAELTAMLHALAAADHHSHLAAWTADVRGRLRPELSERLQEAEFLWRSSRADFLLPARPGRSLSEELDDVDRIDDETYVASALVTTCGSDRVHFGDVSPLTDATARERALDRAQARGAVQEVFAERLLADPAAVRARVRETLEQCAEAFFDAAWPRLAARVAADVRVKTDLLERKGIGPALASVSAAVTLVPAVRGGRGRQDRQDRQGADGGECIVVDKLQDTATSARETGVTFIPSVFGTQHLVAVHTRGRCPVLQYPVAATPGAADPVVALETVERRLRALAHPVRLRLVRTLARGPHTTGELADAWGLTAPEVSRHLAALRKAGLLGGERHGRYVRYTLDSSALTALGQDLLSAVLR